MDLLVLVRSVLFLFIEIGGLLLNFHIKYAIVVLGWPPYKICRHISCTLQELCSWKNLIVWQLDEV